MRNFNSVKKGTTFSPKIQTDKYDFIVLLVNGFAISEGIFNSLYEKCVIEFEKFKAEFDIGFVEQNKIWHIRQFILSHKSSEMSNIESELNKINHYSHIPEMKPFIGKDYFNSEKKVLIVGESHFFDHFPKTENPECNTGAEQWYKYEKVIPKDKLERINTRLILKNPKHRMFSNLKVALSTSLKINKSIVLESIAFMNAFQRPANHEGVGMERLAQEKDFIVAIETIESVIKILKPQYVVFVSKLSWEKIGIRLLNNKKDNYVLDYTSHPNSFEWNKAENASNKEKLFKILNSKVEI